MNSAMCPAWAELPVFNKAAAEFANGLAALTLSDPRGLLIENEDEAYYLRAGKALNRYSLYLQFTCVQGRLQIGLEASALFPQLSLDLLKAGTNEGGLLAIVDGLICDWVDRLEGLIGFELVLSAVHTGLVPEPAGQAILLTASDGRCAHVFLAGDLIEYLRWPSVRQAFFLVAPLQSVVVSLQASVQIPQMTSSELATLQRGAVLLLPQSPLRLVVVAGGVKQLQVSRYFMEGDTDMTAPYEPYAEDDQDIGGTGDDGASIEQLFLNVDIVIETLSISLAELTVLTKGQLLTLGQPSTGRKVSLRCQGKRLASGEIVAVEDKLAVLITSTETQPA